MPADKFKDNIILSRDCEAIQTVFRFGLAGVLCNKKFITAADLNNNATFF